MSMCHTMLRMDGRCTPIVCVGCGHLHAQVQLQAVLTTYFAEDAPHIVELYAPRGKDAAEVFYNMSRDAGVTSSVSLVVSVRRAVP